MFDLAKYFRIDVKSEIVKRPYTVKRKPARNIQIKLFVPTHTVYIINNFLVTVVDISHSNFINKHCSHKQNCVMRDIKLNKQII